MFFLLFSMISYFSLSLFVSFPRHGELCATSVQNAFHLDWKYLQVVVRFVDWGPIEIGMMGDLGDYLGSQAQKSLALISGRVDGHQLFHRGAQLEDTGLMKISN